MNRSIRTPARSTTVASASSVGLGSWSMCARNAAGSRNPRGDSTDDLGGPVAFPRSTDGWLPNR